MNKVFKISIIVVICLVVILGIAVLLGQYSDAGTTNPPSCTEHVDNDNNHLCDVCSESLESTSFTETNDKVYVIPSQLNLRKNPGETGVATVAASMDDELTRIGYYVDGENAGWSKIVYNGEEYYVATDCITIQKPIADADFTFVEETVYGITKNTFIWVSNN